MVPWRACLWLRRNLGSVPLSEGYLWVFGFLMLCAHSRQSPLLWYMSSLFVRRLGSWRDGGVVDGDRMEVVRTRSCEPSCSGCAGSCSLTLKEKVSTLPRQFSQRKDPSRTGHGDDLLVSKGYVSASFGVVVQNPRFDVGKSKRCAVPQRTDGLAASTSPQA